MEAFAKGQAVTTTWSREIARVEHDGTRIVLTALVLENSAQPSRQPSGQPSRQPSGEMRGVKINLSGGGASDQIYLDEAATERTRAALEEIASAVAQRGIPGNGCMGAKEFWPLDDGRTCSLFYAVPIPAEMLSGGLSPHSAFFSSGNFKKISP